MSYRLENGELYPRATHPGSGEAAYWPEGETYTNTGQWPGAMITRETAQNLIQDKAPITLQEWHTRYRDTAEIRDYGDGNPISSIDYTISVFNFSRMQPGRLFTTSG